jgi:hypothetical protein
MKTNYRNKVSTWLKETIIDLNLCPFAKSPFEKDEIQILINESQEDESILDSLLQELEQLKLNSKFKTSLLIFPKASRDFLTFYNIFKTCEEVIDQVGYGKDFQIVCFHPKFYFEGMSKSARGNYVNRSPYPLIHILNRKDVAAAIASTKSAENISYNNEELLEGFSSAKMKQHFPDY